MLGVETRFMIMDTYCKEISISEIARQTGHNRKTVRKANNGGPGGPAAESTAHHTRD